jgi:hypothetical protein
MTRNQPRPIAIVLPSLTNTELVSGLKSMRGLPWIEPEDVAARIVETLDRPRFEVPVPEAMGRVFKLNQIRPFRARSALVRITKADTVLSDIDDAKRAAYVERLERVKDRV